MFAGGTLCFLAIPASSESDVIGAPVQKVRPLLLKEHK